MIEINQYKQYLERWQEIKDSIEGQLENMGFDLATKKQAVNDFKNYIVSPILLGGHVLFNYIPSLVSDVFNSLKSKDAKEYQAFI